SREVAIMSRNARRDMQVVVKFLSRLNFFDAELGGDCDGLVGVTRLTISGAEFIGLVNAVECNAWQMLFDIFLGSNDPPRWVRVLKFLLHNATELAKGVSLAHAPPTK